MTNKFFADFLCLSSQVVYLDTPNKDSPEVCYYAKKVFRVTPSYPVISRRQDSSLPPRPSHQLWNKRNGVHSLSSLI